MNRFFRFVLCLVLLVGASSLSAQAQHHEARSERGPLPDEQETLLQAPGQSVFGAVQEAIRRLEADSTTDWSKVNVEALRQHLIDMERVAMSVVVEEKEPIEGGVRMRVRPTTDAARASLARVLEAHPRMLRKEKGWTMTVEDDEGAYVLRVTTNSSEEVAKIRGLGYIGLLAYGRHHQRHHWNLLRGQHPHK